MAAQVADDLEKLDINGAKKFEIAHTNGGSNTADAGDSDDGEDENENEVAGDGAALGAAKKKRKRKPKKKKAAGGVPTKQSSPPRVLLSNLFANGEYPKGEEVEYRNENTYRTTSEEKRHLDRINNDFLNEYRQGAEIHRQVRQWAQQSIKPGQTLTEIAEGIEDGVRALTGHLGLEEGDNIKGGVAFPTGLNLNHIAAHYSPNAGNKTILQKEDVMCVDFGVHVNGRIVDSAFTMSFDPLYDNLLTAVREATNTGVKEAGIDVRVGDIGGAIQEVMESYEVEIGGQTFPVKCIRNLNGHNIGQWQIHYGKSVPIVKSNDTTKMEEGEVFAIETFGSTGNGYVRDDLETSHYAKIADAPNVALRLSSAKNLLNVITKSFGTLPFCRRYLDRLGQDKYLLGLNSLVSAGVVEAYPPLVDKKGSFTAQFEHWNCCGAQRKGIGCHDRFLKVEMALGPYTSHGLNFTDVALPSTLRVSRPAILDLTGNWDDMPSSVYTLTTSKESSRASAARLRIVDQDTPSNPPKPDAGNDHDKFFWTYTEEPHRTRRQAIITAHPEVTKLCGPEPLTKYFVVAVVLLQILCARLLQNTPFLSWQFFLTAYVIGATANQNLFLAIHEISHNLAFKSALSNRLFAIVANLPIGIPYSASFRPYHLTHHKSLGVDGLDTDLPTAFEAFFLDSILGKAFFCTFQILFYALRPMMVYQLPFTQIHFLNIAAQILFDVALVKFSSGHALAYLIFSSFLAGSLHPCAGHFIAEHYVFEKQPANARDPATNVPVPETFSYYGPLNMLTYNVGLHNEHHDFPAVPWTRLPALHEIANEFYAELPKHKSWIGVIWQFVWDKEVGLSCRVKRKEGGRKVGGWTEQEVQAA